MIEAFLFLKKIEKKVAWKLELKTLIKGKEYKKEAEGIINKKEELRDPIDTLISLLKKKNIEILLITNSKEIKKITDSLNLDIKIQTKINKELLLDISEVEDTIIKTSLPDILNIRLSEIKEENAFLKSTVIHSIFLKAYLFFLEYPERIIEIPLFIDLKNKGLLPEDSIIEDIFSKIEETIG